MENAAGVITRVVTQSSRTTPDGLSLIIRTFCFGGTCSQALNLWLGLLRYDSSESGGVQLGRFSVSWMERELESFALLFIIYRRLSKEYCNPVLCTIWSRRNEIVEVYERRAIKICNYIRSCNQLKSG